jgi:FMN-dependent NADH-azoreductase
MPNLLHIDVSPRGDYSVSRNLSTAFAAEWKNKHSYGTVAYRDLAASEIPFVDLPWIMGAYSAPETHSPEMKNALGVSDTFIGELLAADEIVIGTPMYNFNLPARLKAWIDHIVRHGKTFSVGAKGYEGLAGGRKVTVIIASAGNYLPGAPTESYNFEGPYLKFIFGFIGITDVNFVLSGETAGVAQGKVDMGEYLKPHLEQVKEAVA